MNKPEKIGGDEDLTKLEDLFERQPEVLEAFKNETVKLRVVLEGHPQGTFFVDIENSQKAIFFTSKNVDNIDIEVFVDDLRNELADLGVKLP